MLALVVILLLLLGWAPEGEEEIFSLDEMVRIWNPGRISKSPAIFDPLKLRAINAAYIRALPAEEFRRLADPFIDSAVPRRLSGGTMTLTRNPSFRRASASGEVWSTRRPTEFTIRCAIWNRCSSSRNWIGASSSLPLRST